MSLTIDPRRVLRDWVCEQVPHARAAGLDDCTPLFGAGLLRSVQVTDLIFFIEELRGAPLAIDDLRPGAFRDIDTICKRLLETGHVQRD